MTGGGAGVVVAAFDVDGTLTTRDCVRPFLERLGGRRAIVAALARRPVETVSGVIRRDRDRLKEVVVGGVFRGRRLDEVEALGREFAGVVASTMLRADTIARLRWHQQMRHRTVLVSASLRPYLAPLGAALGIDHVMCTDVAHDGDHYLDRLDGPNCRAEEKHTRLREWLDANALAEAEIWAYGNSNGDRAMLERAHRPTWVRRTTVSAVPSGVQAWSGTRR